MEVVISAKFTGQYSRPLFHPSLLGSFCVVQTWRHLAAKVGMYRVAQKRTHVFQIIVTSFIFNIKKITSTPKQPVINAVFITYINYSITENYIGKMASFLPYTRPEPLLTVLHHIYLPAISFFGVTSNQKSTFENLVQSTI